MRFTTSGLFDDGPDSLRSRIGGIYCLLFLFNAGSWIWAVMVFDGHPALLGTAFLAYSLGLRHAVDADHIVAIDNVTRKLMQAGKRPVGVGFLFSLGHSTIVLAGAAAIAGMALTLQNRIDAIRAVGRVVGTLVSTVFLFAIAMVNLIVLRSTYRAFVKVRSGVCYQDEDFDTLMGNQGCLSRVFRPILRMIERSRHMYALGLLFGLGLILQRRSVCWEYQPAKHRKESPSIPSSCFQCFLRPACRSSTRQTTSSCWVHMDGRS